MCRGQQQEPRRGANAIEAGEEEQEGEASPQTAQ